MESGTDQATGAKRRHSTRAERAHHLKCWKRSGLSAKAYAAEHGLNSKNLYAWASQSKHSRTNESANSHLVPLRMAREFVPCSGPRVTLRDGRLVCQIEGAGSVELYAELASKLKREVFDV